MPSRSRRDGRAPAGGEDGALSRVFGTGREALVDGLAARDVRAAARLISRIERGEPGLQPLMQALYRAGGRARIVGVTGPPGAGKSTLVGSLIRVWRARGLSVAVLAVDPSSPVSGGAVLGDRMRMMAHGSDGGVFIRSMASRGELGGLARAAGDALTVLDAMGWDIVLVETVGVGQNETDIMRYAAVSILLQTPMGGDEVQAGKAGINEIADIFVVNKSDHPEAARAVAQLEAMIRLAMSLHPERVWRPPVVKTQAVEGRGIADLAGEIDRFFDHQRAHPEEAARRRRSQAAFRVGKILHHMLEQKLRAVSNRWLEDCVDPLIGRDSDPYTLAETLLSRLD